MYKCVVFDLDGTLVNSLYDLADSVNKALEAYGLPSHPYDAYKYFVGNGRAKLIERAMGEASKDDKLYSLVTKTYDDYYLVHCLDKTEPYDGIVDMLSRLQQNGVKINVLSNKPDEFVKNMLDKLFSGIKFDVAWGKMADFPTKPDPSSVLALINELSVSKSECIYVGDSNVDVITARNAGLDFCGVLWGFRTKEELENEGAKITVSSADELCRVILNG
ncbi:MULTISPECIES: HAD family hydrolase [unclassified Ruminococcus]|uniref:HAD family hydrolase n=1 Tax=unclassified Ruminococcus TaxID=2608920 RepID=UPI0021087E2C|nr:MULTISPECIES: HAD family hydrolase [unclassified Ruminococcus]MCQ4022685.1 HAD-IA family hydrolase [Ruminococcus sp. zg-924]MCQ4114925.1 HAD-IA family hydrolase [Ruminococcus sp. zg-921]